MSLFRQLQPAIDWLNEVEKVVGQRPVVHHTHADPSFPWQELEDLTKKYVSRNWSLRRAAERDSHFEMLVSQNHRKHIALIACVKQLSHKCQRKLLDNLCRQSCSQQSEPSAYFEAVIALDHLLVASLRPGECSLSKTLLCLGTGDCLTKKDRFEEFGSMLSLFPDESSPLFRHCGETLSLEFGKLNDLMNEQWGQYQWESLRFKSEQLTIIEKALGKIPSSTPTTLRNVSNALLECFPKWKAWARWKPDAETNLAVWIELGTERLKTLGALPDLEGPDFVDCQHKTKLEWILNHSDTLIPLEYERGKPSPLVPRADIEAVYRELLEWSRADIHQGTANTAITFHALGRYSQLVTRQKISVARQATFIEDHLSRSVFLQTYPCSGSIIDLDLRDLGGISRQWGIQNDFALLDVTRMALAVVPHLIHAVPRFIGDPSFLLADVQTFKERITMLSSIRILLSELISVTRSEQLPFGRNLDR